MKVAWNYCRKFQLKRCQKRQRNIRNVLLRRFAPPPYRKTKYCGDHLCLFVGLCVRVLCEHISETTHPVITKYRYFCCDVTHSCGSALFLAALQHVLRTSVFMNDVMFAKNGRVKQTYSKMTKQGQHGFYSTAYTWYSN